MRPTISLVLVAVLVLFSTFVSCNNQESINEKARLFVSPQGDYSCDLLNDTLKADKIFPWFFGNDNELESVCANYEGQYIIYTGKNYTAMDCACHYNMLLVSHNLNSDVETAVRFGDDDENVYSDMADSIMLLYNKVSALSPVANIDLIPYDGQRELISHTIEEVVNCVRNHEDDYSKVKEAYSALFNNYLNEQLNPIIDATRDEYISYMTYLDDNGCYGTLDSVMEKRGKSDRAYQQELLTKLYLAKSPAERHIYALEFAHSDSTNAHFMAGAVVLHREFVEYKQYSPYLYDMWRTWRAICSTQFGYSSWSYIPNLHYNRERKKVADIIISHIENNPTDTLAQGVLISLAGCENIERRGSLFGNGSMNEQMLMFPEWEEKIKMNNK